MKRLTSGGKGEGGWWMSERKLVNDVMIKKKKVQNSRVQSSGETVKAQDRHDVKTFAEWRMIWERMRELPHGRCTICVYQPRDQGSIRVTMQGMNRVRVRRYGVVSDPSKMYVLYKMLIWVRGYRQWLSRDVTTVANSCHQIDTRFDIRLTGRQAVIWERG